jgi:hypothetical protein
MFTKRTPEETLNSARIRERMDKFLRDYYRACISQELPHNLRATLKKFENEEPTLGRAIQRNKKLSGRAAVSASPITRVGGERPER